MFFLVGDYIIPVCRDEISPRPAGTDLTLRLHVVEIKFRSGRAEQFSTWHLFRFVCNILIRGKSQKYIDPVNLFLKIPH